MLAFEFRFCSCLEGERVEDAAILYLLLGLGGRFGLGKDSESFGSFGESLSSLVSSTTMVCCTPIDRWVDLFLLFVLSSFCL